MTEALETKKETPFSIETLTDHDLNMIRKLMRALDGQSIEDGDVITKLTNPADITERTRFVTFPVLQKNVYLRIVASKHPELKAFRDWADREAHALISYKGKGREEYVEMSKAPQLPEAGTVIGSYSGQVQQQQKRRFWQRGPKPEPSEFKEQ